MKELLSVENLDLSYGGTRVLKRINLSVMEGEFVALLGSSGSGKTSLLRSIGGFVQPDSGDIKLSGKSIVNLDASLRPVNTVFQNYALFPHYSVYQNVAYGPKRQGLTKHDVNDRVMEALIAVGMESYKGRYPAELSGGQQQRIALARAIVNKPTLLLLDEPLGALDLKLRQRMQDELKSLHQQLGLTFLHVTHDQEEALALATRIAVMQEGEIVQYDSGEEIYRRPKTLFVADFLGNSNIFKARSDNGQVYIGDVLIPDVETSHINNKKDFCLMTRPEDLYIDGNKRDCSNSQLVGDVVDIIFLGRSYKIQIDTGNGNNIVVDLPSGYSLPEENSKLNIYFDSRKMVALDS